MTDLILRHARLPHGAQADLRLSGGRIAQIAGAGTLAGDGATIEDLGGSLLVPGFVEGHVHLDKTLIGVPWMPHLPGTTVAERIAAEKRLRQGLGVPVTQRAEALLARIVALGSVNVRCHVDIDDELGLAGVEALLALRERWRDRVTVQLVAFPQSGILRQGRVAELLEEAARQGVEAIGGLDPAGYDGDIKGQLDIVFGIAERHGRMVDIHLHDPGELGAFQLRRIAERSAAAGMQGRVAVSHAFALGEVGRATFEATAAALRDGGVAIMTAAPGAAPMPPVAALHDAGVTVFAGSDNIRDAWSPLGNGDMLDRARLIAWRQGFAADEELWLAFATITEHGLRALGLDGHGIREGAAADLVVLPSPHVPEAVAECPPRSLVVKAGCVVARGGALTGPH